MAEIDRLQIKLTADASSAKRSVNNLVHALEALNKALGSLDVGNLNNFNHVVRELADSVSALNSSTASIRDTARAFNELGRSASSVNSAKDAVQNLKNATSSLSGVGSVINEIVTSSNNFGNVGRSFRDMSDSMTQLSERVRNLSFKEVLNEFVSVINAISGSNQKLIEESNIIDGTFREVVEPIEGAGRAFEDFARREDDASESARNLADTMRKVQGASLNVAPQGDVGEKQISTANRANTAIQTLKSGYEGFLVVVKKVGSAFGTVAKRVLSASLSFKSFQKAAQKAVANIPHATDLAKKFGKEITRIGKMLKLMITRMALRKVISEVGDGFKSLALHSEDFNNSVSSMMNGAKKLGYSFAAMVSPLINALAPAIVYVINLLIKLANVINQVFSALTGMTTFNKAKDFAENWADNINAANKEAKQLKKTVLGFDELNQMQEKHTSGGGTSGNIVDMFDTEKIDPKWKKIADWLKKMWELGDFTELGTALGKKLRDALESIPWDKIRQTANKLGGALATLINGFVEVQRLGYDIGKTVAQSVNTVFEFLNGFVHKLHWDSIGKFIAETFNGFFENIDWVLIKDTVVTGLAGLAEAIQTFIDTFHWDNLSTFIINGVDTVVSGIKAFFEGIDWHDLGQKMGDQIKKSIEGIDWHEVGVAIGDIIKAAIDWVSGMLETLPSVDTLVEKASDLMHGLFDRVDFETLGANLGKIMQYIFDFITGFWDKNGEEIKNKVKEFFKGLWDNLDKEDLGKVLGTVLLGATLAGIANALGTVAKIFLTEKIKALITGAASSAAPEAAAAGTSVAASVVGGIVAFFAGAEIGKKLGAYLKPDDKELYESYSGIMGTIKMLVDTVVAAYDLWIMKAEEVLENLKTVGLLIEAVFLTLATSIKKYIDEIVQKFVEFKTNVETKIGEIQTAISEKIAKIKEDISSFIKDVKKFFDKDSWTLDGVAEGLTETFKKAKEGIKDVWNSIAEKLNGEYEIAGKTIKIKLPTFAYGGFPEDGLFMANHGELVGQFSNGKTAVANNAQIVEGISAGVFNAVSSALARGNNGNGNGYIANTIVVDGEVIARTVTKAQQRQNMRYSPSMG